MTVLTAARARRTRRTRLDGPLSPTRQIGINIYTQARVSRGLTEVLQPLPNPRSVPVAPRERDGIEDPREGNAHSAFLREVFRSTARSIHGRRKYSFFTLLLLAFHFSSARVLSVSLASRARRLSASRYSPLSLISPSHKVPVTKGARPSFNRAGSPADPDQTSSASWIRVRFRVLVSRFYASFDNFTRTTGRNGGAFRGVTAR